MTKGTKSYTELRHRYFSTKVCQAHQAIYGTSICGNNRMNGLKVCEDHAKQIASTIGWKPTAVWDEETRGKFVALQSEHADTRRILNEIADERQQLSNELFLLKNTPPAERKRQQRDTEEGHIYALLNGYNIKIGWSGDLERRLREYPPSSQLLLAYPGTRKDETALKRKFSYLATHGTEWFPYAPQVTDWVELMVSEHGEPKGYTAGPRKAEVPRPHADKPVIKPRAYR